MWLKLILGITLGLTLILGVVLLWTDLVAALVVFGVTAFDGLLFYSIMPRRFQIFEDRLRIVLGSPFAFSIYFSTIKEVRSSSFSKAFAYWGVRFATSTSNIVEIVRSEGWNVVISPVEKDVFVQRLTEAIESSKGWGKQL